MAWAQKMVKLLRKKMPNVSRKEGTELGPPLFYLILTFVTRHDETAA